MKTLQEEIIKLVTDEGITTGEITNRLNQSGWGVRVDDVLDALQRLEVQRVVERLWRRKQSEANSDVAVKKAASVGRF